MKFQQAPVEDVLARDGETAILLSIVSEVIRLGELGSAIYRQCATPKDVVELADALERLLGTPTDITALAATEQAVKDMVDAHVLELVGN